MARRLIGVIVGGADNALEDLRALAAMRATWPHDPTARHDVVVIGVNQYPPELWPHHWVTLHPENLPIWQRSRDPAVTWSHKPGTDRVLERWTGWGGSGLYAVKVALHLHCSHIVLTGVPMDDRPHVGSAKPWADYLDHRKGWVKHRARFETRLRSMSGWTRETFGAPTPEWLHG